MKIVEAVNMMITRADLIKNIVKEPDLSSSFLFDFDKYRWAITKRDSDDFILVLFPNCELPTAELAELDMETYNNLEKVAYATSELKTKEAIASFADLYRKVQEKMYGIDQILDKIINLPPF
ncbi:MAG: hypothetical protein ACLQCB_13375 [Spirochaetia bacterium]